MASLDARALDQFSGTVASLYDAALAPERWPIAMERIAHLHGSDKALLFTPTTSPAQGGFAFPHGISETAMLDWGNRYIQHDPWTRRGVEHGLAAGEAVVDTDLVPDDVLLQSVFYREFLVHHDIRWLCTGMVFDGKSGEAPMTGCSVYGAPGAERFDQRSRWLHRLVLDHLSRALGTMLHLRDAELRLASSLAALDRLDRGVLLLDIQGGVLFANRAAMGILDENDGLSLRPGGAGSKRGVLRAFRTEDDAVLRREIKLALGADPLVVRHFNQAVKLMRRSGRRSLVLQFAPLSSRTAIASANDQACLIAFLTDPDRGGMLDEALMERLYGVTPAESRLARELMSGDGLTAIALRLGISHNTVKKQLQGLFLKTETHRQAELVRLLMSLLKRG